MKKKISLILCLMGLMLLLSACGEDPESVDYFGMTYQELQGNMEQEVSALVALDEENLAYIQSYGAGPAVKLVTTWDESTAELGAYQGLGRFSVSKAQDTMTVEQNALFETREVTVTYVYTYDYEMEQAELTDANVDLVYTLGEKMSKAALNTLMGMGTVFAVLILISLIIYGFRLIPYIQNRLAGSRAPEVKVENAVVSQIEQREEQLTDDLEIVAVITAAIAAGTGASADSFVVRSIRRRK